MFSVLVELQLEKMQPAATAAEVLGVLHHLKALYVSFSKALYKNCDDAFLAGAMVAAHSFKLL